MAAFHMEALKKQRFLDKRIAAMERIEKESQPCECRKSPKRSSTLKKGSAAKKPSASKKSSESSGSKKSSESSASKRSSESSSTTEKSRSSVSSTSRSTKQSSRRFTPLSTNKFRCPRNVGRQFQSIPPGMSPLWYHHLNRQARILRDHGLVMGHLAHFID
ncbi:uncharacterized protein LOC144505038 isoform X2 [Mustelus asterias]